MSAVAVVVALSAGGCGGGGSAPEVPTATLQTAPLATTTTNPYAVPAVIDEAYVNRVLAGLDHANGDILRLVVTRRTIPPEVIPRLKAIYIDEKLLQEVVDGLQGQLLRGVEGLRNPPGNQRTTVLELITAEPDCIFAKTDADASAVAVSPEPSFNTQWVGLISAERAGRPVDQYNPTGWGFVYEGFTRDFSAPPNPCDTY